MSKPKFIIPDKYATRSQRYEELLEEGIEWVQKFSGNLWTDYNFHDPGITFLEQFCFGITDLGYKTNFPINDILFIGQDKFDLEEKNLFYPPHKVLPSSPITSTDFRKLILDKIDAVQNAWVVAEKDNLQNISGLYSVRIQLADNLNKKSQENTLKEVDSLLMRYRCIGTDFTPSEPLKKDEIRFECEITLDSFAVGEQVLAHIYRGIEKSISNKPIFSHFTQMEEKGVKTEDLFTGTYTEKGYLEDFDFNEKTSEIYISEIKEIIYNVEGVLEIENLIFFKNDIRIFDDYIPFENNAYPYLIKVDDIFFDEQNEGIRFSRNESNYKIDKIIFKQIYDSLTAESKVVYKQKLKNSLTRTKGRFKKNEFEKYYSIMRELPSIYGLKEDELPSKSSNLRKSQTNQLRAYLLFFDQLMANHVTQLSNIRQLFSIDLDTTKTFFGQVPTDVPDLKKIIGDNIESYKHFLNDSLETKNEYFTRKNRILDHLMARFGETFDTNLLGKFFKLQNENCSEEEVNNFMLSTKIKFVKNLVSLGYNRPRSFDYTSKDKRHSISGIENRLRLKLGLTNNISDSIMKSLSKNSRLSKMSQIWRKREIQIDKSPKLEVFTLPQKTYTDKKIHFHLTNISSFKFLFLSGLRRKNYMIVSSKGTYNLLFKGVEGVTPAVIYQSKSLKDCDEAIDSSIKKIKQLDAISENIFMIENILLRPVSQSDYSLIFYDAKGKKYLESYYKSDLDNLRDLKSDFIILAVDKKNFNVVKKLRSKNYEIILYDLLNRPLFKSSKSYKNESEAKDDIPLMIQFFKKIIIENQIDENSKMVILNDISNKFPDSFNYSNHINFVFPDWPVRFQNKEFKNYLNDILQEYIPAHLTYDVFYLDINQIDQFEQTFTKWKAMKNSGRIDQVDSKSLQLIQLLMQYKKDGK